MLEHQQTQGRQGQQKQMGTSVPAQNTRIENHLEKGDRKKGHFGQVEQPPAIYRYGYQVAWNNEQIAKDNGEE